MTEAKGVRGHRQVVPTAERLDQTRLLDDDTHLFDDLGQLAWNGSAEDLDLTRVGSGEPEDGAESRGLPGSVGTEKAGELTGGDLEVETIECLGPTVALVETADPDRGRTVGHHGETRNRAGRLQLTREPSGRRPNSSLMAMPRKSVRSARICAPRRLTRMSLPGVDGVDRVPRARDRPHLDHYPGGAVVGRRCRPHPSRLAGSEPRSRDPGR